MKIVNNTIIEATEEELYQYWLDNWSELFSYPEWYRRITTHVRVVEKLTNDTFLTNEELITKANCKELTIDEEISLKTQILYEHFNSTDKDYISYISYLNNFGKTKFIDTNLNYIVKEN